MLYDLVLSKQASRCASATALQVRLAQPAAANNTLSNKNLLVRNRELAKHNKQLTASLARVTTEVANLISCLTPRQEQIMALVLDGHPSKNIAADLNISQRTVENHRAAIMRRTGASSIPALMRLSLGIK